MIRARVEVKPQALDDLQRLEQFLTDFAAVAGDLAQEAFQAVEQPFLNELQAEAGAVKYPIQWKSERQRRAFFATNGFGRGIPTRRTRRMVNAWQVRLTRNEGAAALVVSNNVPYTQYVVGRLRVANPEGDIQPFHRNTGWQPVHETVAFWFDTFQIEYSDRFDRYLAGYGIFTVKRRNR